MTKTAKGGLPEDWLPLNAIGKHVNGTRFLPFKVPLKDALCNRLAPEERFTPAILMEKEPNLRLIIDLTNTSRYYDQREFTENGVQYQKIFCPGRQIPPEKLMKQFFRTVDDFMNSEDTEDKYIGVHCTHGINRTGYFICAYMIKKMGFTPDQAIKEFQDARGYDMIREYLIQELKKISEIIPKGDKQQKRFSKYLPTNSLPFKKHNNYRHNNHQSRAGPSGPPGGFTGFSNPPAGFSRPRGGFSGPRGGYSGPRGGFSGPRGGFSGPRDGFSGPRGGFSGRPYGNHRGNSNFNNSSAGRGWKHRGNHHSNNGPSWRDEKHRGHSHFQNGSTERREPLVHHNDEGQYNEKWRKNKNKKGQKSQYSNS